MTLYRFKNQPHKARWQMFGRALRCLFTGNIDIALDVVKSKNEELKMDSETRRVLTPEEKADLAEAMSELNGMFGQFNAVMDKASKKLFKPRGGFYKDKS